MTRQSIVYLLALCLLLILPLQYQGTSSSYLSSLAIPQSEMVLADAVIEISSDADFASSGYPGSGTPGDPYRIENQNIPDTGTAISISNVRVNFVIQNCIIGTSSYTGGPGILFENSTNGVLKSCTIKGKTNGIRFMESDNCSIQQCTFTGNYDRTVRITDSEDCNVTDCTFTDNWGTAIDGWNCPNLRVEDNTLTGNTLGIVMTYSDNCKIISNTLTDNGRNCIETQFSKTCNISSNNFDSGGLLFMGNWDEWNHTVESNSLNGKDVGYFFNVENLSIDCSTYGQLFVIRSVNISLSGGIFSDAAAPIHIKSSQNVSVTDCTISNAYTSGINIEGSYNVSITEVSISNTIQNGISVTSSTNTTILKCQITDSGSFALELHGSEYSLIQENLLEKASSYGLVIMGSNHSSFIDNNLLGMGFYILEFGNDYHLEGNLINGKQFGYFDEVNDLVIQGSNYGQIILDNCNNITVVDGTYTNSTVGLQIGYSPDTTITGCAFSYQTYFGISLTYSPNTVITNSTFLQSGSGLEITRSNDTTISNNQFQECTESVSMSESHRSEITDNTLTNFGRGIYLYVSNDSIIKNNEISGGRNHGILLSGGNNLTIKQNTISHFEETGIRIWGTTSSKFTNNYLYNNSYSIFVETGSDNQFYANRLCVLSGNNAYDNGNDNQWDDGISQGNWWSDYTGSGVYDVSGSAGSIDNYPSTFELNTPVIDSPGDTSFSNRSINANVTWIITEANPFYYTISVNGIIVEEADWIETTIVFYMDSYAIGVYDVELKVIDGSLNTASDSVTVTVFAEADTTTTTTTTTIPSGGNIPLDLLLLIGGVGIVAVVVIIMKRR